MSTNRFLRAVLPRSNRALTLAVEAGQVVCPRRGITDIEQCFACSDYHGPDGVEADHGEPEAIVCSPSVTPGVAYVTTGFVPR